MGKIPPKKVSSGFVMLPLKQLKTNPKNPRVIKDEKFFKLVESIKKFPKMLEIRPIVVNADMMVLGGTQRLKACKEIGLESIPVIVRNDLSLDEQQEFILKDNVSSGEWDFEILMEDFDVDLLKECDIELPEIKLDDAEDDDFVAPESGLETDIVLGDLFEIGKHRLLCGDSTSISDVEKLMCGEKADLLLTDPPYGVSYTGKTKSSLTIENDSLSEEATHQLWRDVFSIVLCFMRDGASIYATVSQGLLQLGFMRVMHEAECLRQCMVWNKGRMVLGHSDYHYAHEPILYGWKPGKHYFTSDRTKTTVITCKKPNRNADHPTMKPIELWQELMQNSTKHSWLVIDPFLGSGTSMVAAHQLKRRCYGVELCPRYCQVIVDRMIKLDPTLEIKRNGETYHPAM